MEENSIRYAAGYVIRKLENKYSHIKTEEAPKCCVALGEIGGKLKLGIVTEHQSSEWTKLTDHGGLYHIQDLLYKRLIV